jgi:hypothetical protein
MDRIDVVALQGVLHRHPPIRPEFEGVEVSAAIDPGRGLGQGRESARQLSLEALGWRDRDEQKVATPGGVKASDADPVQRAGREGLGQGHAHLAAPIAPSMIGADGPADPVILDEEPRPAVRTEIVEGDDLALVVVQNEIAQRPVQTQEGAGFGQFAAVGDQVPEVGQQGLIQGLGQSRLAGAAYKVTPSSTPRTTTAPAPTMQSAPMVSLGSTRAPEPKNDRDRRR